MVSVGHWRTHVSVIRFERGQVPTADATEYRDLGGVVIDRALQDQAFTAAAFAYGKFTWGEMPDREKQRLDGDIRRAKHELDEADTAEVRVRTPRGHRLEAERCGYGFVAVALSREVVDLATNQLAVWLRDAACDAVERAKGDLSEVRSCRVAGGPLADPLLGELLFEVMPFPLVLTPPFADQPAEGRQE